MNIIERLAAKWSHPDYPPTHVDSEDIVAIEVGFDVVLPDDYKRSLLNFGVPSVTGALLSCMLEADLDFPDLSDLSIPKHVVENTVQSHGGGLPKNLIIIGYDCMGSMFCFDMNELKEPNAKAMIYHWDHDSDETGEVATSFTEWLELYLGEWTVGKTYADF